MYIYMMSCNQSGNEIADRAVSTSFPAFAVSFHVSFKILVHAEFQPF